MKILQKMCFVFLLGTFSSVYGETSLPQEALDRIEIVIIPSGYEGGVYVEVYNGSDWAINDSVDAQLVATGRMSRPSDMTMLTGTVSTKGGEYSWSKYCLPYSECEGLLVSNLNQ
jgi:hypothetical protein